MSLTNRVARLEEALAVSEPAPEPIRVPNSAEEAFWWHWRDEELDALAEIEDDLDGDMLLWSDAQRRAATRYARELLADVEHWIVDLRDGVTALHWWKGDLWRAAPRIRDWGEDPLAYWIEYYRTARLIDWYTARGAPTKDVHELIGWLEDERGALRELLAAIGGTS